MEMDFYDIAMRAPSAEHCCSVNPWKSRLALNFKNIPHTTKWVPLPEIPKFRREKLGMGPCRKHANGSDFFTLPVLVDHATGAKVGDSFDIALYLQKTYPDSGDGDLFPAQKLDFYFDPVLPSWAPPLSVRSDGEQEEYASFNTHVDAAFSVHAGLMGYTMPVDSEATRAEFIRRSGLKSWDDFEVKGEAREQMIESFKVMLGDLAKVFTKTTGGPFTLGARATYADIIVGGWLYMASRTLVDSEWQQVRSWHGGVFGDLFDGLKKYAEVK
ncbi:unnamed protein product [Clonostachys byssicola]|uniref:GST N-terminal domain-containing protein n=1 Tax=Clonostachys byssicola TaxID=160290 RepID=A0A9N9Y1Q9_9HYPO|nr:unnamed protein product [Clonostachys byssicola]